MTAMKGSLLMLLLSIAVTSGAPAAKAEAAPEAMAQDAYHIPYHSNPGAGYHPAAQYLQPIYHPIYKPQPVYHPRAGKSLYEQHPKTYHHEPVHHVPQQLYKHEPAHKLEPKYHKPEPKYHHKPEPKYHHKPEPKYHKPEPKYHKPEPKYHKPAPKYHKPEPKYIHKPEPKYHEVETVYHPETKYHAEPSYHKPEPYKSHHDEYKHEPKPYAFDYGVKDQYHGTNFGHSESSDGKNVQGSYSVALPDGRIQHVKYVADHHNGFQAEVTYEGEAHYPEYHGGNGGYQPSYHGGNHLHKTDHAKPLAHHNSYSPYH